MHLHEVETIGRDALAELQVGALRATLERARRSPFYGRRLAEAGIGPQDIRTPGDIRKLPLTTKDDLRAEYPFGLVTCPREELVRLHASSGTTGASTVVFHDRQDLDNWSDLVARCMYMVGMRPGDVFQNMTAYGLFTGGLGMHYGAERLGCLTVPAGPGNTQRQVKLIRDFSVTALHIIPSYALHFAGWLEREGIDPGDLTPRIALIGAEPHTGEARSRIESLLELKAYNSYGLSEMNGPGVAFECPEQQGMHLWEDAFLMEVVDPETLEPVPDGEPGELVLTTLQRHAMPILRYRTKDITRILPGECACGRTHRRIDRITGRSDDMFIIKGVNIYPMQIERVLLGIPEVGQNYLIILDREQDIDRLRVKVEIKAEHYRDDPAAMAALHRHIIHRLRDELLVTPGLDLMPPRSLPEAQGKAQRVEDLRPR